MGPQRHCGPCEWGMRGLCGRLRGGDVVLPLRVEGAGGSDMTLQVEHGDGGSVAAGAMRPEASDVDRARYC